MKLLIEANNVIAVVTDDYPGPMIAIPQPEGFDVTRINRYKHNPDTGAIYLAPPTRVSMSAGCTALLEMGYYTGVEAAVAAMESPYKEMAQIQWTRATEIFRNSPIVGILSGLLELTEAQLDQLFLRAGDIDDSYNTHL